MKHPLLKDIIISPPFGKWLKFPWATSIDGSYTVQYRSGLIKQILKTVRKTKSGWINQIELRNPGVLTHSEKWNREKLVSVVALEPNDWDIFWCYVPAYCLIELNLGCPNTSKHAPLPPFAAYINRFKLVSVKLPGVCDLALKCFDAAYEKGIRVFHICNTIPVPQGGLSGRKVKDLSLLLINTIRATHGNDFTIIGGGGIYTPQDVIDYKNAGADHFSLSTIWFTPWKVPAAKKQIESMTMTKCTI